MSVNIKLKHSAVNGKAPQPSDLTDGELALNTNAATPAAYIKDSAGNIVKLAGDGSVGPDKKVDLAGDTMTGNLTVPSINGGQLAGFRNQIINGDFAIQQRGGSNTTGAVYTWADRWFNRSAAANVQRFNLADIPPFNYQAGVSTGGILEQRLELQEIGRADRFVGTWTLSYWANEVPQAPIVSFLNADAAGGGVSCTVGLAVSGEVRGTWTHYQHSITMATPGASNIMLRVALIANATAGRTGFTGVQLEPGPVATPFEQRPIGAELALCQRYFEASGTPNASRAARWHTYRDGNGTASTPRSGFPHYFNVPKRANPTMTFFSYNGTSGAVSNTTGGSTTALVSGGLQGASTDLHCSLYHSDTDAVGTVLSFWGDFYADAEL